MGTSFKSEEHECLQSFSDSISEHEFLDDVGIVESDIAISVGDAGVFEKRFVV